MSEELQIVKVALIYPEAQIRSDQIKQECQKIPKKSDVDEMPTILPMANEKQYLRNLQWTPEHINFQLTKTIT